MTRSPVRPRPGFTLIELLIVIGIIVILAALGALFLPHLDRNKGVPNATTQVEGWVRITKSQALRDGAPRGIRLIQDPNDPTRVNAFQYIEQPDPVAPRGPVTRLYVETTNPPIPPNPLPPYPPPPNVRTTATLAQRDPMTGNLTPITWDHPTDQSQWLIAPGDFLEITGSPHVVARVVNIVPANGIARAQLVLDRVIHGTDVAPLSLADGFRVIRAPRPLAGEPLMQLHRDVYIDLTCCYPCPPPLTPSPDTNGFSPQQQWSLAGNSDILFNSNGLVANATTGQIMLCVRHVDRPNDRLLVVIYTRTGKVTAVHWFDGGGDPYVFARDARASGF